MTTTIYGKNKGSIVTKPLKSMLFPKDFQKIFEKKKEI